MNKNFVANMMRVLGSNVTILLSGVLVSFVLPKIMTVEDYGYYKTFTLYTSYLGLFGLGIMDGISLKYGDKNLEHLDKKKFRAYSKVISVIQIVFAILICFCLMFFPSVGDRWVLLFCALILLPQNLTGYFQHISQITQRFKEYSLRNMIKSILTIVVIVGFSALYLYLGAIDFMLYTASSVAITFVMCLWYVITYQQLVFGESIPFNIAIKDIFILAKNGVPLMLGNLCTTLLFSIDRQIVSLFFTKERYAIYAFAYNLFSLVTVATSAVSSVMYPMLKRKNKTNLTDRYPTYAAAILIFVFFVLCSYFPFKVFIAWFLPDYLPSMSILRIIFPGIAINSVITVVMLNFYKATDNSKSFFIKSVIILVMAVAVGVAVYFIFKTEIAISIGSVCTLLVYYILADFSFAKKFKVCIKNFIYMICMMAVFYLCTVVQNEFAGIGIYLLSFFLITVLMYVDEVKQLIQQIMRRRKQSDKA